MWVGMLWWWFDSRFLIYRVWGGLVEVSGVLGCFNGPHKTSATAYLLHQSRVKTAGIFFIYACFNQFLNIHR